MTESHGKVGARFRGGRRSTRRASGGVEPFHTLEVALDDRGGDLMALRECRLVRVRARLVDSLEAMDAAGHALRWTRHLLPTRHAEPQAWTALTRLLDGLDGETLAAPRAHLALTGLRLLAAVGYALELSQCVVCARPCPDASPAYVDAARGGIVCSACGGRGQRLDAATRQVAVRAQRGDEDWRAPPAFFTRDQTAVLALVERAMAAHTDLDSSR